VAVGWPSAAGVSGCIARDTPTVSSSSFGLADDSFRENDISIITPCFLSLRDAVRMWNKTPKPKILGPSGFYN